MNGRPAAAPPRPLGITLLALVQMVSAMQLMLGMIWCFVVSASADDPEVYARLADSSQWLADNAGGLFFWLGVVYLVLFLSAMLMAYGYLKGRKWARKRGKSIAKFAIIFAIITIVLFPVRADPGSPWWTILFNLIIIFYLNREKVVRYFELAPRT